MSLEWFSRMENAVRISLPDLCEEFDNENILFDTDSTEQHPTFTFSVESESDFDEFCIILFDPTNQEFYSYHYDDEAELHAKVLFANLDQMLSFIHASYHDYLDEVDEFLDELAEDEDIYSEFEVENEDTFVDEDGYEYEDTDDFDEGSLNQIEWISNEKFIHIEDNNPTAHVEHSITYKLGVDQETGDGVIYRTTISRDSEEETEEKVLLYFKEEEADYLKELVQEYTNKIRQI